MKTTIEKHAGRFKYTVPGGISEIHERLLRNQQIISLNVVGDERRSTRQKMTEPNRTIEIRINLLPSKSHEFSDQWSTPVVQFDRSTYRWRDKNRHFDMPDG